MQETLVFTMPHFPFQDEVEKCFPFSMQLDRKLNQSLEEMIFPTLKTIKIDWLFCFARLRYKRQRSFFYTKALNKYNKKYSIIKNGPAEYRLFAPQNPNFRQLVDDRLTFCNLVAYKVAHFCATEKLPLKFSYVHISKPGDILLLSQLQL